MLIWPQVHKNPCWFDPKTIKPMLIWPQGHETHADLIPGPQNLCWFDPRVIKPMLIWPQDHKTRGLLACNLETAVPIISKQSAHESYNNASLKHRPLDPQEIFLVLISVRCSFDPRIIKPMLIWPQDHKTRDLPACSAVPQPTAPPLQPTLSESTTKRSPLPVSHVVATYTVQQRTDGKWDLYKTSRQAF